MGVPVPVWRPGCQWENRPSNGRRDSARLYPEPEADSEAAAGGAAVGELEVVCQCRLAKAFFPALNPRTARALNRI